MGAIGKIRKKMINLMKLGESKDWAFMAANTRHGHWYISRTVAVNMALIKERLIRNGFYDVAKAYQSVYINY